MEDKLRSLGILGGTDKQTNLSSASVIDGIDLEAYLPPKKVWRVLHPTEAFLFKSTNRSSHINFFVLAVKVCCFVNGTLLCIQDSTSSD